MEIMGTNKEQAFKKWLNESSNWLLCSELKKLTWKTMKILNDRDLNPGDFIYDWMRIHSWFCNYWVNSDYEEPGTPDIAIPIYIFAKCPDLQKVAEILHREKWINVVTDDALQIDEACNLAWLQSMDIIWELKKLWLRDWDKMKEIIDDVLKWMNKILPPEFKIYMNTLTHEIYIKPNSKSKEEIIKQTQLFKDKIKWIVDFFQNDETIKNKIELATSEQNKGNTNNIEQKKGRLASLMDLL